MGRYVILTKSSMKKRIGRDVFTGVCVVAFNLTTRRLERFVANADGAPLPGPQSMSFEALDEVEVTPLRAVPQGPQTENHLVADGSVRRIGCSPVSLLEICSCCPAPEPSYVTPDYALTSVAAFHHSVELCLVEELKLTWDEGHPRPRASFRYRGVTCAFYRVTDARYERATTDQCAEQVYPHACLAVSIPTDPYEKNGKYYKFIAAIYPIQSPETPPPPAPDPPPVTNPPPPADGDRPWTAREEMMLREAYLLGEPVAILSLKHRRSADSIRNRLIRLGLLADHGGG